MNLRGLFSAIAILVKEPHKGVGYPQYLLFLCGHSSKYLGGSSLRYLRKPIVFFRKEQSAEVSMKTILFMFSSSMLVC